MTDPDLLAALPVAIYTTDAEGASILLTTRPPRTLGPPSEIGRPLVRILAPFCRRAAAAASTSARWL
jgi:hypothetical protein